MRNLLFILFVAFAYSVSAQNKDYPSISYDRWMIDAIIGRQIALNNLATDAVADGLLSYGSASYLELFSGTYFFNQEWGINVAVQMGSFDEYSKDRNERLETAVEAKYGDQYFIDATDVYPLLEVNPTNFIGGMTYGLVYRCDKSKFRFLSSLDLGFRTFEVKDASYLLKEKGSNNILSLSYSKSGAGGFLSVVSPRVKCLYQLKDDIYLKLDLNYALLFSNLEIVEEIKDSVNNETSIRAINYSKTLHAVGFGLGIAFFL